MGKRAATDKGEARKSQRTITEEPSYMRTARFDGRRSVDLEEFVKDERVRNQLKRLAEASAPS